MEKKKQVILIAEDNEINRSILAEMLSNDYTVLEAVNGQETIDILLEKSDEISALLLDIVMPVKDGYAVLQYLREQNLFHVPVIVMTGDSDKGTEEKALDLGAWDFISKPYQPKVLLTRMKNAIARSKMSYLSQIKHTAEHDQLTDLYNRRHFFEVAESVVAEHKGQPAAFIRIDINRFRLINSFWGEKGGDELLKFLANEIQHMAESYSWFAYGHIESDVFGMCIPYDKERCNTDLQTIIHHISGYSKDYLIEPSIGIYLVEEAVESAETMYMCATLAAKQSKDKYMTYVSFYDPSMSRHQLQEQEITQEMQGALEREEFQVYFQPKYNTQSKTPFGAEALVRWKHPQKGMLSPGLFIPVFEKNGFIGNLDYYIWEKVCVYLRGWMDEGLNPAPVSVNMSRAELTNPALVEMLIALMEKYQLPAKYLQLELTESAYMDNPDLMDSVIRRLHKAGFVILMDDFGSGFSSLNTLKDIAVDILKIDMKFLSLDESNVKSKKILASVITMAQWLGLPVITEGVETEEQYNFLQSIGCEYIQGYYFARPMPVEEYEKLIRSNAVIEANHNSHIEEYVLPQNIRDKIYKDDLTGAYNRRYLNEWLFLDLDDHKGAISLAMILLDLKSFKQVNDLEGYLSGDEVLQKVAHTLLAHIRKYDAVIRYGGDEFIMVLVDCTEAVVIKKIQELKLAIHKIVQEKQGIFEGADFGYSFTQSFHKSKSMLMDMIAIAEKDMNQTKRRGED